MWLVLCLCKILRNVQQPKIWKHTYNICWSLLWMFWVFLKRKDFKLLTRILFMEIHRRLELTNKKGQGKRMARHLFPSVPLDLCMFLMSWSSKGVSFRTPQRSPHSKASRHLCSDLLVLLNIWHLMVKTEFASTLNIDEVRSVVLRLCLFKSFLRVSQCKTCVSREIWTVLCHI